MDIQEREEIRKDRKAGRNLKGRKGDGEEERAGKKEGARLLH